MQPPSQGKGKVWSFQNLDGHRLMQKGKDALPGFTLLNGQDEASSGSGWGERKAEIETTRAPMGGPSRGAVVKEGCGLPSPYTKNKSEKGGVGS